MKRIAGILAVLLLGSTACTPAERPDDGYDESLYRNDNRKGVDFIRQQRPQGRDYNQVGFGRQKGNELYNATDGGAVPGPDVYIDRNVLARQIAFLTTKLPRVEDCSVIVTDDQVLIGVKGNGKRVSRKTLYEAKRTALSLTPRYYHVHVTGDPKLRNRINQIGQRTLGTPEKIGTQRKEMERLVDEMRDGAPPDINRLFDKDNRRDKIIENQRVKNR
ncbi:YhcN/YlaJ family sporulation lipoprotein [Salinithrix halophila]|uniref:YhcN/YlaJ family sporulation lipoprotein n=1 Tax=Salinithrix halophila TaxID=1485204 RepID=A0ABV8JB58_9BACL